MHHHSENKVFATVVIFISVLGESSLITVVEWKVINIIGLEDITSVSLTVIYVVSVGFIFDKAILDILGSKFSAIFGSVSFVVALEWKQLLSCERRRLHYSLLYSIAAMQ